MIDADIFLREWCQQYFLFGVVISTFCLTLLRRVSCVMEVKLQLPVYVYNKTHTFLKLDLA